MSSPPPAFSTSSSELPELRLKPREERRIAGGHLWIFSNEVDTVRTPLTAFATGAHCRVVASNDRFLGYAYDKAGGRCRRRIRLDYPIFATS